MKKLFFAFIACIAWTICSWAQPRVSKVDLSLVPNHSDAIYQLEQHAIINLSLTDCGMPLNGATIYYEIGPEMMTPYIKNTITLDSHTTAIDMGTMSQPGFLRIKATLCHKGKTYSAISTVGFTPDKLTPKTIMPDDFKQFWDKGIEAVKKVDLASTMTLNTDLCSDKVDVYDISFGNIGHSRIYGTLAMPKAPGTYPAILQLPGGGFFPRTSDTHRAANGVIILNIGIHGIPVNLPTDTYQHLNAVHPQFMYYNMDNPHTFYYYRAFLGSLKAVDFLTSLPQCNGKIGTLGGSQGGALSIVVSALDPRIKATVAYHPGLCDLEGFLHNRAGGFPFYFFDEENRTPQKLATLRYYDIANFARLLTAPLHYTYGYNDTVCTPTSTCSTYNIVTAPKTLNIAQDIGHWLYPELSEEMWTWIIDQLKQ